MKRRVIILVTAVLLFGVLAVPVGAVAYGRGTTIDHAGAPETISVLYNEIYDQYGVDAFFVTALDFSGEGSAREYANVCIGNLSSEPDRIVFVHTLDDNYILPEGKCKDIFTDDVLNLTYYACAQYITAEDYGMAATAFFAHVRMNLGRALTPEQYSEVSVVARTTETETETQTQAPELVEEVNSDSVEMTTAQNPVVISPAPTVQKQSIAKPILICLALGAVIALITVLAVRGSYKPVHRKTNANEYLIRDSLNITNATESFVRKETTERKLNNDSSKN